MDYNKIILDNSEEKKLFHAIISDLRREYSVLAKATAQGETGSAALVVGAMEKEINLLIDLDKKLNDIKDSVNVA